jgi:hypothetical protein
VIAEGGEDGVPARLEPLPGGAIDRQYLPIEALAQPAETRSEGRNSKSGWGCHISVRAYVVSSAASRQAEAASGRPISAETTFQLIAVYSGSVTNNAAPRRHQLNVRVLLV